jgi:hypothetical protein
MAQISAILLDAIQTFAAGAPQDDDITVVLVKREAEPSTVHRSFERSFDSIEDIVAFTAATFASQDIDPELLPTIDFAVEELFTNSGQIQHHEQRCGAHRSGQDRWGRGSDADRL